MLKKIKRVLLYIKVFLVFGYLKFIGFTFKQASTKEELMDVFRLRYQIYSEEGYIDDNETLKNRDTGKNNMMPVLRILWLTIRMMER